MKTNRHNIMTKKSRNLSQHHNTISSDSHNLTYDLRDGTIIIVFFITSIREVLLEAQVRAVLGLLIALSELGDKGRHSRVPIVLLVMAEDFKVGSGLCLYSLQKKYVLVVSLLIVKFLNHIFDNVIPE
jgi:hypothetical protein